MFPFWTTKKWLDELYLRHRASSSPGRWGGGALLGVRGSAERLPQTRGMWLHPCFHAAGSVICDYTAFYFIQSLVNLISSLIWWQFWEPNHLYLNKWLLFWSNFIVFGMCWVIICIKNRWHCSSCRSVSWWWIFSYKLYKTCVWRGVGGGA